MRSSLLTGLTTRGTSFLTAGAATVLAGLLLGSRVLVSVGVALIVLPVLARLAAGRARFRLSCTRAISPARVPAGTAATVTLQLENASRLPTGLMLAEDSIPYALGTRPRYVLEGIERGGVRELSYPLRSDLRGKFDIGPLEIRIADAFGVVELARKFSSRSTLVVTPRVVALPRTAASSSWAGDGDGLTRTTAAAGEDDVIPRAYRNGDELRRVHWRSTARYGELMVRREEQRWRNRALLFLDTRRSAHSGTGVASSFEFAVSAAASVGVHLAREGLDGQLITDGGAYESGGIFEDVLLDSLAVIKTSPGRDLGRGVAALRAGEGGLIVAVMGRLSADSARQLAACRRDQGQAIALLLAVSTWADPPQAGQGTAPGDPARRGAAGGNGPVSEEETAAAEAVLRGAGWRVVSIDAATPLAQAWQLLPRLADHVAPAGSGYGTGTGDTLGATR
ncbi:MAG TPA: DUF58 domain-containing protein [Streptosporangiaceae bacterium]|nr:DUF58 domain-containing protein [Streptosporangiaceae bacterium]